MPKKYDAAKLLEQNCQKEFSIISAEAQNMKKHLTVFLAVKADGAIKKPHVLIPAKKVKKELTSVPLV